MPTPTYTDTTLSNLVISKISQAKFDELKTAGLLNEDELYLVENETLDAMGNVVKNVGTPVQNTDAANKAYVDGKTPPVATSSTAGIVKPDGTTITVDVNGVLSAVGGGGGGATGYGTVSLVSDVDITGSPYISIDGVTYKFVGNFNSGAAGAYTIIVPVGKTVICTGFAEYNNSSKNGSVIANPSSFVIQEGDAYLFQYQMCLSPETEILMANGIKKKLKDIQVGDLVATPFGNDTVTKVDNGIGKATDVWTFDDGTIIKTIGRHRFFNCELNEPMYLEAWNIGEHALKSDGKKVALVSHERIEGDAPHATLFTREWNLYYANGLLAGNRKSKLWWTLQHK